MSFNKFRTTQILNECFETLKTYIYKPWFFWLFWNTILNPIKSVWKWKHITEYRLPKTQKKKVSFKEVLFHLKNKVSHKKVLFYHKNKESHKYTEYLLKRLDIQELKLKPEATCEDK